MNKLRWLFVGAMLLSLVFASLSPQPALGQARLTGTGNDVLRLSQYPVDTLDPSLASFVQEVQVINSLFAGLVKLDLVTGQVVPDLAESWSWNAEKTEITFTLRSGLLWSDGTALTASDARYAILRELDPEMYASYAAILDPIVNAYEYRTGQITDPDLVGVIVDDATHLRIQLTQPMVFFDKIMALWVTKPLPQHVIALEPDNWTDPVYIVTSGPYVLTQWDQASYLHLAANANYYGTPPGYSEIAVVLTDNDQLLWDAYLQGNLDTFDVTAAQYQQAQADPILADQTTLTPGTCTYALVFKTDTAPMDNANVRKALIAAIDRTDFAAQFAGDANLATQTWTPPTVWGYVDGPALGIGIPFDVTQAQAYLTAAGYPNGVGFPAVTVEVRDTSRNRLRWDYMAAAWQANLNITISVTYIGTNPAAQPINFAGWCGDYNEAFTFVGDGVQFFNDAGRLGGWSNAAYDTLIDQISQETDLPTRLGLYEDVEQILVEDEAVLGPLYNTMRATLTKPYLQRTVSGFSQDYWYEWSLIMGAEANYDPGNTMNFEPGVDTTAYQLPAAAFTQPMVLTHTALRPDELAVQPPAGLGGIGHAYDLTAVPQTLGSTLNDQTNLPYLVTIPYSPEQVAAGDVAEETLGLYALVEGVWINQNSSVNTETHELTTGTWEINTDFAIFGVTYKHIYLPGILR